MTAICNPNVPASFPIPYGVFPGRIIRVKGHVPSSSPRFAINLQCGPQLYPNEDIAFHFNPRFPGKVVVRNHFAHSHWGSEEVSQGVPLNQGDSFEILIYCFYNHFKVEVNGKFVCKFNHCIWYRKITHIMVDGQVTINEIDFIGANPPQDLNLIVPCVVPIPAYMQPGRTIRVRGTTLPGVKRFAINIQCGPKLYPEEDIAFHFNPRFEQRAVVRNHFAHSSWGHEETDGPLPLRSGENFEVFIHCYQGYFKAFMNGLYICQFTHRIPPIQRISHVMVDGDTIIHEIDFDVADNPYGQPLCNDYGEVPGPY